MRARAISSITRLLRLVFRRSTPVPHAPRSIVIVKPCCLGDVLLTTPLLAAVRRGFPGARITYAVGTWARPMIAHSVYVDQVLTLPDHWTIGSLLATARLLRQRNFDLALVPDRSPVLTLLVWLAGIRSRVGLDSAGRGFAYTTRVPVPPIIEHEADTYARLAPALGLPLPARRLYFFPAPESERRINVLLAENGIADRKLIALHPGGGQNPGMTLHRKRWLPDRWATVADRLIDETGAALLLVGGPGDEDAAESVIAHLQSPAVVLIRRWSWDDLGALIRRCDLFLGHDTGMMHLAVAVDTPTVAVFGPSDPQIYGPYSERGTFVWRPTPESPCFYNGVARPDCPCAMQCMRNVEADLVLRTARQVLQHDQSKV